MKIKNLKHLFELVELYKKCNPQQQIEVACYGPSGIVRTTRIFYNHVAKSGTTTSPLSSANVVRFIGSDASVSFSLFKTIEFVTGDTVKFGNDDYLVFRKITVDNWNVQEYASTIVE